MDRSELCNFLIKNRGAGCAISWAWTLDRLGDIRQPLDRRQLVRGCQMNVAHGQLGSFVSHESWTVLRITPSIFKRLAKAYPRSRASGSLRFSIFQGWLKPVAQPPEPIPTRTEEFPAIALRCGAYMAFLTAQAEIAPL